MNEDLMLSYSKSTSDNDLFDQKQAFNFELIYRTGFCMMSTTIVGQENDEFE